MKLKLLLAFIIVATLTLGCAYQNYHAIKKNNNYNNSTKIKIYFYYERGCPNCMKIEPYMKLLRKELKNVEFYFCDLEMGGNCSKKAIEFEKMHKNLFPGFVPCPTAVVVYKNYTKVLIGYKNISKIGIYLRKFNISTPKAFYNNTEYDVQSCIACHEKEKIPPPSRYNCTYCCHYNHNNRSQ